MKLLLFATISSLASVATAWGRPGMQLPPFEESDITADALAAAAVPTTGDGYFIQWLDHDDHSKGTFKQHYWWNSQWYAGPGSPMVLFTPGESAAGRYGAYLTNVTLPGKFAQEIKGGIIMVEHRFYGDSSPFTDLNAETMQLLTLHQSILDFVNVAKTIKLPFDPTGSSNAAKAPWVMSGGSYSGALSAWTYSLAKGTFWAYHASSAVVEAIDDYWQYFVPVQQGMPKNCSTDIDLVINYMDKMWEKGTEDQKYALKEMFGLESLEHPDDVMAMLEWGPWQWQGNSFYTGYSAFYQFCDMIENVEAGAAVTPSEKGVGLTKALAGYAKWVNETMIPAYCQGYGYDGIRETECMDTYNPLNKIFTDTTVNNTIYRQWQWMLCNEPFAYWQDGAPRSRQTLVSRLIKSPYWQRQCALFFPIVNGFTFASALSPDNNVHQVNKHTQGWRLTNTERLIWANGEFDPWLTATVSSEFRPGGPLQSTAKAPINIIPGGFHCSDLRLRNGEANAGAQKVIDANVAQIVKWVSEFPKK